MRGSIIGLVMAVLALPASALAATQGERVKIKGEIIDTWCYFSGVMGGPDSVVGSAHHTCALWCAAGGIPVGVLAEDGTVYMVLKYEGDDHVTGGDTILEVQSNLISADGLLYQRDGINYLVVEKVTANEGIVNLSHEDYDVIPPFAIPKPKK
ncbi:MAG: hypothetical protein QNJ06_07690 [Kiloniellales bacterium]|nr:hypothetical protein [Kiloniellales bacterium]